MNDLIRNSNWLNRFLPVLLFISLLFPMNRNGTTTANFLEIDIGSKGTAMGGAVVSVTDDVSSVFWNPAGLAGINRMSFTFVHQPWLIGINHIFTGVAIPVNRMGTFALSLSYLSYGDEEVTTVGSPDGTGELYNASEYVAGLSYSRRIVDFFSFGVNLKYISSSIWHMRANAAAVDLGVIVSTQFFVPDKYPYKGLKIGMSISNYGTKMRYDGIDLLNPIDITDEYGNFANVPGLYKTEEWELPLIFRIGVSMHPLVTDSQEIILALDALHPNNNSESVNFGGQYELKMPGIGSFFIRAGYKGRFIEDSEYGPTFGGGIKLRLSSNNHLSIDYSHKTMGRLGNVHLYTLGIEL